MAGRLLGLVPDIQKRGVGGGGDFASRLEANGSVLWQGSAENMEESKARVKELQMRAPAPYMIVSLKTGSRLHINSDGQGLE
jgi:hypothetical protein